LALAHRSSPEYRARLHHESEIATSIVHPNVVATLGSGETNFGDPYIVMEVLHGETLAERLERRGPVRARQALAWIRQAGSGLEAAHREGIVHRDIKPSNLFLCAPETPGDEETLKVFDFGFAKAPNPTTHSSGNVLGTLEYMAPEQIVTEPADARADIYALGVVLYRLITGELPFDVNSQWDLLSHHMMSPVPPPSWLAEDLAPEVETLVLTALRKNPANRYATVADLLEDIARVEHGQPVLGAPLLAEPDCYVPRTELGRQALSLMERRLGDWAPRYSGAVLAPPPLPDEVDRVEASDVRNRAPELDSVKTG
jgi:serine/threonine-protein kinase